MATSDITFFPVGNGDMTLIRLATGRTILIDINIRKPGDGIPDVADELRGVLKTDANGRPYVDVMVLSHPDQDHCRGLLEQFYLGPLASYDDKAKVKKIVIKEMWSSPLVFRRASKKHTLCDDAKAWNTEARRRANLFKTKKSSADGDRLLIIGEDENGHTDGAEEIVVKAGTAITKICGEAQTQFSALVLAPMKSDSDAEEEELTKNESSTIMNYTLGAGKKNDAVKFLSGGDAEVAIWERQWACHKENKSALQYNLLSTPHHCSWRSLSYDSWSEKRRKAVVSVDARKALSQALPGAQIVASSCAIKDDDNDPPCIRAKEEYVAIAQEAKGDFWNTGSYPSESNPESLIFEVTEGGLRRVKKRSSNGGANAGGAIGGGLGSQPLAHG